MKPKPAPPPVELRQCEAHHCAGVRCRRPHGHAGLHEYERPSGTVFYWQ